jgi:hypothetical protein
VLFTDHGVILEKGPPAEVIGQSEGRADATVPGANPQPVVVSASWRANPGHASVR